VYEAAAHAARRSRGFERGLLEDWMLFMEAKGVVPPRSVPAADWTRATRLAEIMAGGGRTNIRGGAAEALGAVSTLLARLELHRDLALPEFTAEGWTGSSGIFRYDAEGVDDFPELEVSAYFLRKPRGRTARSAVHYIALGLTLTLIPKPELYIFLEVAAKRGHAEYDHIVTPLHWPPRETVKLFAKPFDKAHREVGKDLRRGFAIIRRTAIWRRTVG
jgi:hypothetical protein